MYVCVCVCVYKGSSFFFSLTDVVSISLVEKTILASLNYLTVLSN